MINRMILKPFSSFCRDQRGATIIEFAVIAPFLFFIMLIIIELGMVVFSQVALESATMQVSRSASIGVSGPGCDRVCTIRNLVQEKTLGLVDGENVVVQATVVSAPGSSGTSTPDICLTDPPTTPGSCPNGKQYIDGNNNGQYDGPGGVSLGTAGDLVEIRVTYPWELKVPFLDVVQLGGASREKRQLYGKKGVILLNASTVIKNEPF